jgi:hypothetical protein
MKKILALQALAHTEAPEAMNSTSSVGCGGTTEIAVDSTCSVNC